MNNNESTKKGALFWNIKQIVSKGDYLYALVPEYPNCTKNGYVLLHRVIMENHLGRLLNTNEIVHHIDENKKNNLIENLQVMTKEEHNKYHGSKQGRLMVKLKCPICKKEFEIEKRKSFFIKPVKYPCTCCCNRCRGILYRFIQMNGLTKQVKDAISENFLSEYRVYLQDNSEETVLQ